MESQMENLNQNQMDALKEMGNIGAGNAITALSQLLGKRISMKVPVVKMVEFKHMAEFLGGPEQLIAGVLVQISGDINGIMMFLVKKECARELINTLMTEFSHDYAQRDEAESFTELENSALQEIGNILTSSYLGSLANLINKRVIPSTPMLSMDMANAILSVPAIEFGKDADCALLIESLFDSDIYSVSGYFLLVPDDTSLNIILTCLGAK
ncbi:MAG: chemotaxis protein CheC [Clostridiales bacterium]|jgi:chemotaxis protein CheC|nr:chemotaxis protein CheC [Clostridiales bacterium]